MSPFISLSSLFKRNQSLRAHVVPKGHFNGPANIYHMDYAASGLPTLWMHADLFVQVFVRFFVGNKLVA